MKKTTYDEYCRKLTKLPEDSSESKNKVDGHSHRKINSKGYTKGELNYTKFELNFRTAVYGTVCTVV